MLRKYPHQDQPIPPSTVAPISNLSVRMSAQASLRKVLLQLLYDLLRFGELELAWGPLLNPSPELHTWGRTGRSGVTTSPVRPTLPLLQPRVPTHCCRPGAAASPRSCPCGAWRGSPAPGVPRPPGAAPGSGPRRCARTRVSSC